jgi:hypothetical protein
MNTEYTRDLSADTKKDKNFYTAPHSTYHKSVLGGISIDSDSGGYGTLGLIVRLPNGSLGALTCNHVCGYSFHPHPPDRQIGNIKSQGGQRLGILNNLSKNPANFGGKKGLRAPMIAAVNRQCINISLQKMTITSPYDYTQMGSGRSIILAMWNNSAYFLLPTNISNNFNLWNASIFSRDLLKIYNNGSDIIYPILTERAQDSYCQEDSHFINILKAHISDGALIKIDPIRNPMDYIRGLGEGPFEFYSGSTGSLIGRRVLISEKNSNDLINGIVTGRTSVLIKNGDVALHNQLFALAISSSGGGNSGGIVVLKSNPKIVVGMIAFGTQLGVDIVGFVPIQNLLKTMSFSSWNGNIVVSKRNDPFLEVNGMKFKKVGTTMKPVTHIVGNGVDGCLYMEQFSDITGQPYRIRKSCARGVVWCGARFKIINGKKVWTINSSPTYICRMAKYHTPCKITNTCPTRPFTTRCCGGERYGSMIDGRRVISTKYKYTNAFPNNLFGDYFGGKFWPIADLHSNVEMSVGGKPNIYFEKRYDNNTKNSFEYLGETIPDKFENLPITFYAAVIVSKFVHYSPITCDPCECETCYKKEIRETASIKASLCWTANYDELINGYDMCNYATPPQIA